MFKLIAGLFKTKEVKKPPVIQETRAQRLEKLKKTHESIMGRPLHDAEIMSLEHLGYIEPNAREEGELQWRKDNGMEK